MIIQNKETKKILNQLHIEIESEKEIYDQDIDKCIKILRKHSKFPPETSSKTSIKLAELNQIVYRLIKNLRG